MYYKNISAKAVLAKVYRDFRPVNSGWVVDAIEWMGEALAIIGHACGYERRAIEHEVKEYKARLKCEVDAIEMVQYNGSRLLPNDAVNSLRADRSKGRAGNWYTLNPNYINTSFECGTVTIYADVIAVDGDGYPLVPDEEFHKAACAWYIMMMLCARGYKHPVFTFEMCEARWTKYYPMAQNAAIMPDIEKLEQFRKRWTALVPRYDLASRFFDDLAVNTLTDDTVELPRDNVQTIVHVSNETDDIIGGGGLP